MLKHQRHPCLNITYFIFSCLISLLHRSDTTLYNFASMCKTKKERYLQGITLKTPLPFSFCIIHPFNSFVNPFFEIFENIQALNLGIDKPKNK